MLKKDEKEILKELRDIQKDKENWKGHIDEIALKLNDNYSDNVRAKALWMLGEMGLQYPDLVKIHIEEISGYLENENPKFRERSINALGRIGRADKELAIPYLDKLMKAREDEDAAVRLSFIWACENIGTNAPELFCEKLDIFYEMISDSNEKVRMEVPEMFRVIGKRKHHYVEPYLDKLEWIGENDEHPVVRIHSKGAVRITKNALEEN
ncbi:sister chromatid cohesion protein PDS5 [Methanobrevibacter sp.]|uniref:sister chromatid cohesion protein PDS5 n=1 Tax=Methanobrevibacter sp. TaxID=66852 RepID=UPI0025E5CF2F|nr:sister chromatid cohesion protein PDS5 [Methanobrevibacter sp.]MBQ2961761.1 HEAT repeat domain-containing protein [Methanobrevibacter sp.]